MHHHGQLVERRHEVARRNQQTAADQRYFRGHGRHAFCQQAHQHHGKNRDEVDRVHLLQVAEQAVLARQQRRNNHGGNRHDPAKHLAGFHHLLFRGVLFQHAFVDPQAEDRRGAVQRGVKRGENRPDHHRRKEAGQVRRKYVEYQVAICLVRADALVGIQVVGDDAGQHQVQRPQQL